MRCSDVARIACLAILIMAVPLYGEAAEAHIQAVQDGLRLVMDDGATVRPSCVEAPSDSELALQTRRTLESLAVGRAADVVPKGTNRYSETLAEISVTQDGGSQDLAAALVKAGAVFVFPDGVDTTCARLAADERKARAARRGLWADDAYADQDPKQTHVQSGRLAFVRGPVVDVARIRDRVYVNFGDNWRTDFTVEIAPRFLRPFKKAGLDIMALKGRMVRVRGVVQRHNGPMIEVTDASQLEALTPALP